MIYRNRSSVIHFALVDAVDGSAVTSGTVSAYITQDGGTQASVSGSATHEGNGQWSLPLSASETNAMSLGVLILESGSVPVHLQIFPQYRDERLWYADANASSSIDGLTPETPFDNLSAAKSAASAGDTIIVKPGTYNEKDLAKNGVNWHFEEGAAVTYTGSGNGGIWDDTATGANGATSFSVTGFGKFTNSGTGSSNDCIRIGNASSVVSIECREAVSTTARGVASIGGTLRLNSQLVQGDDAAFDLVGGTVLGDVLEIYSTTDFAIEVDSDAQSALSSKYVHTGGEVAVVFASGSAAVTVEGAIVESDAQAGDGVVFVEGGTGSIHFDRCVIRDSGAGSADVLAGYLGPIIVSNCYYDKSRTSGAVYDVTPIDANGYAKANAQQIGGVTAVVPLNSTETQAAAASALAAYDPPTNTELEARTIVAANYATAADLTSVLADTAELQGLFTTGGTLRLLFPASTIAAASDVSAIGTASDRSLRRPAEAFIFRVARRSDGTYTTDRTLRLRPGTTESIRIGLDMSRLTPRQFVYSVGTPSVSGGSLTATSPERYDELATYVVGGTATASESRTIDVTVTMEQGDVFNVTLPVEVFAD